MTGLLITMHENDNSTEQSVDLAHERFKFVFCWVGEKMTLIYDGLMSTEMEMRAL